MPTFETPFGLGDRVVVDDDESIVAVVTQVCWGDYGANIQISWFSNGNLNTAWVADPRLAKAPPHLRKQRVNTNGEP